jgi:hypothetical protein
MADILSGPDGTTATHSPTTTTHTVHQTPHGLPTYPDLWAVLESRGTAGAR